MSEKQFDFSIRMDKENSTPELEPFDITVTPDTKGPKSVAILMFFGGLLLILLAFGDFQLSQQEDLTDEEIEIILETPNADLDTDISNDDYQKFHDSARQGYLIRAAGLAISGSLIVLGAPFLYSLNKKGAYLGIEGAAIGLVTGVLGSMMINDAAVEYLSGPLLLTYKLLTYSCGICMLICGAMTSLPLVNARARMALNGKHKVKIKADSEGEE
ncbi:MAG: hypothetical protein CL978_00985 [Euryarchaeota archaeon]|jgi:hypothetical protein|nr:hypothetical protein [Euryarchaeota archaeon]|tara:strand:- start:5415 stop:6059 length:645 start_codon:yes stop_codon:yes gene_type:complete